MTGDTKRLKVGVLICAALGNVEDVVNLKVFTHMAATLAGVAISDQDAVPDAAPRPTASP